MRHPYYDSILLVERQHRYFLEVVKVWLDRQGIQDINNVQALILYNLAKDELTVGELTARGIYLGSNVSYNVSRLVENEYLVQERSPHDRRSIRVKLSPKGLELWEKLNNMFSQHVATLTASGVQEAELMKMNETLRKLESLWAGMLNYFGPAGIGGLPPSG